MLEVAVIESHLSSLIAAAEPVGRWMLGWLAKGAVLVAIGWILAFALRHKSSAVRHGVWVAFFAALVALPLVSGSRHPISIAVSLNASQTRIAASPAATEAPSVDYRQDAGVVAAVDQTLGREPDARGSTDAVKPVAVADASRRFEYDGWWYSLFSLIWLLGTIVLLARLVIHHRFARQLLKNAKKARSEDHPAIGEAVSKGVTVYWSTTHHQPCTIGLFAPVILLPREALSWTDTRLRAVLAHEMAHIERRDHLSTLVCDLTCILHWLNPLVWTARNRVHVEHERACDDRVLAHGREGIAYADDLLQLARAFRSGQPFAVPAMARRSQLKQRIRNLLGKNVDRKPLSAKTRVGLVLALVLGAVVLGGIHPYTMEEERRDFTYVWLEAESGRLLQPMVVRENLSASSGMYVMVPDGRGNDPPMGGVGSVTFSVMLQDSGAYYVWGRCIGDNGNDNSFFLSFDDMEEARWDIRDMRWHEDVRDWNWVPMLHRDDGGLTRNLRSWNLDAGRHTIQVRNREDGTRLDRILITNDPDYRPDGLGEARRPESTVFEWFEAEHWTVDDIMEVRADREASAGGYIVAPPERGGDGSGNISLFVEAPEDGLYVIWARLRGPERDANSLWISVDGEEPTVWDVPGSDPDRVARNWQWDAASARQRDGRRIDPLIFEWEKGLHHVSLTNRESGTQVDAVLVTNNLHYEPRGTVRPDLHDEEITILLEAEDGEVEAPMMRLHEVDASGGLAVNAEAERSSRETAPVQGGVRLPFTATKHATYTVWGRVLCPDDSRDSFWIRVDDGDWIRWNGLPVGPNWHWEPVRIDSPDGEIRQFSLSPGEHVVEVRYRESGARLDNLIITSDSGLVPEGMTGMAVDAR